MNDKQQLLSYNWPGNVRELQNVIERAIIVSDDGTINLTLEKTPDTSAGIQKDSNVLTASELITLEKENITRALKITHWKISGPDGAAELLEMPASTLSSRMKTLGIIR